MAEALLEVVLENLNSLVQKEIASFCNVGKEIEKLTRTLTTIKAVLEDAEQKQITNQALKLWLQELKDAACVLDDILDECSIKSAQLGFEGNKFNTFLNPKNILFRRKVGKKMKEIRERIDEIAEERVKFGLRLPERIVERQTEVVESRQTCSIIPQPQVYGRDDDRKKIVEFLLSHASDRVDLSIYSIVGIGGVGKTLLAQLVFNDEGVSRHFDLKIWVCVSENFSVIRILQSIIGSILKENCDITELEAIQKRIRELLQSKRYLLVLDDVWNGDQDEWDKLKSILACGSKGASILVTTRLEIVASIVGTIPTSHHLQGLSDDTCWSLFKQRAFALDKQVSVELVALREEIVKKCGGLPLVANALGGLLRLKSEKREWLDVIKSEIWNLPKCDNSVLSVFMLSYFNLSLHLRQCFAFCAIFPKDAIIKLELLIHLWMANGFIPSSGRLAMEDIGREVWNELYQGSFFQDINTDEFGQVKSFKMHDLVHDLACSIAGKECMVLGNTSLTTLSRSTHHIGSCGFDEPLDLGGLRNVESLRTLLLNDYWCAIRFQFSAYHSVRALGVPSENLSISLKNFIHLRYLDLSHTDIYVLPKSIYSLQKLQTLKLKNYHKLLQLPKHLRRLKDLRHILIRGCDSLSRMPLKIRQLTCLKSLSIYIVGSKEGYRLAEIRDLELAGELHIKRLEKIASLLDARAANLIGKKDLQCLRLSWSCSVDKESPTVDAQQVLDALQPHSNLKCLEIEYYLGAHFPTWISNIASLVFLQLSNCENCVQLPPLGKFPCLRSLKIDGMVSVQYIDDEPYDNDLKQRAFMSLETLEVSELPNLESFFKEKRMDMFPCLSKLSINHCPKLRLPGLPSVKDLHIWGCREELLCSISNCHNLTSLELSWEFQLTSFPEGMMRNLSCLKTLIISDFYKLKVLPIELVNLVALDELQIEWCDELESFPNQFLEGLSSLRILQIKYCHKFRSLSEGVKHLTLLEHLEIHGCPNLEALPNGMNHLNRLHTFILDDSDHPNCKVPNCKVPQGLEHIPYLRSLKLCDLTEVKSLPDSLGELTTLQSLSIVECPKLKTLPTSFQHLTNLHKVQIMDCPELEKRCKEETWDVVRAWTHFMTRSDYRYGIEWKRKG